MREIKFRAFSKEEGMIYDLYSIAWLQGGLKVEGAGFHISNGWATVEDRFKEKIGEPEVVLMQSTGLQDKTGKEIYEGDIIEHQVSKNPSAVKPSWCTRTSQVVWYDGQSKHRNSWNDKMLEEDPSVFNQQPGWRAFKIKSEKDWTGCVWSFFASCKVIGNIYSNPELLQ